MGLLGPKWRYLVLMCGARGEGENELREGEIQQAGPCF
jgi:hypothetical protein